MKTPREMLLERHSKAESKLNAVRRQALATVNNDEPENSPLSLRDWLQSLRWHLAGMSAIWLFVVCLHLDTNHAPRMLASIPPAKIPPPQAIMASLRENRRQLSEMTAPDAPAAKPLDLFIPRPRSERRGEMLVV